MSVYFEKARELGELILQSEESIRLADAKAEFDKSPEAQKLMAEYNEFQNGVRQRISKENISRDEFIKAGEELAEKADELKQDPVAGALIFAENEFNVFVNRVLSIFKSTITGEIDEDEGCGGGCAGCSGCN